MKEVTFSAILKKYTTTADGGTDITFSVSLSEIKQSSELLKMRSSILQIGIVDITASANREETDDGEV